MTNHRVHRIPGQTVRISINNKQGQPRTYTLTTGARLRNNQYLVGVTDTTNKEFIPIEDKMRPLIPSNRLYIKSIGACIRFSDSKTTTFLTICNGGQPAFFLF